METEGIKNILNLATLGQLEELQPVLAELINEKQPLVFACTCEGYPIASCVFDTGDLDDCSMTRTVSKKADCEYWEKVKRCDIQDD